MTNKILLLPVAVLLIIMIGAISEGFAYTGDTICEDRFYDSEKGCQVPIAMEYQKEEAGAVDIAAVTRCPESYYDAERGCQVYMSNDYEAEYALVKETTGDELIRGCPSRYFDSEKGCQVPYVNDYTY